MLVTNIVPAQLLPVEYLQYIKLDNSDILRVIQLAPAQVALDSENKI